MSRPVPRYRRHKNGQAVVQHKGVRRYLGPYGSDISKRRYRQFIARLEAGDADEVETGPDTTITELVGLYVIHAERYYSRDGKPTKEYVAMVAALRHLEKLFGEEHAADFGPKHLEAVQEAMIGADLSRGVINNRISRIKRFFRWCARKGYVRPELYHGLLCVSGLTRRRLGVREAEPVKPVNLTWVDATLPWLSPTVAAMVRVQLLCGMRPAEVCIMRPCDISTKGDVWLYTPTHHKNDWRGQSRVVAIPPTAQAVLAPFLTRLLDAYLFSPAEAEERRLAALTSMENPDRKTKVYPSERKAREQAKLRRRQTPKKRPKRDHYDTDSYRRAITYGIRKAGRKGTHIPPWHPNQLRHAIATLISQTQGEQAAQRYLGHARLETTGIYVERQVSELIQVARELERRGVG